MNDNEIFEFVSGECLKNGHSLLYLSKFGSHLYGTATENSDRDFKGIFLQNIDQLICGNRCDNLIFKSSNNKIKNNSNDYDISLWSVQYWLVNLIKKGETESIDLLYSDTNHDAIIYRNDSIKEIFNNKNKLINSKNIHNYPYVKYCVKQAHKYSEKGNRLEIIEKIIEYMNNKNIVDSDKLGMFIDDIIDSLKVNEKYIHVCCTEKGEKSIFILGKIHTSSIFVKEFMERMNIERNRYGNRSKIAMDSNGTDWKSISHALRAITQVKQLIVDGTIKFPLYNAELIRNVKLGLKDKDEVFNLIEDGINSFDDLVVNSNFIAQYDETFIVKFIKNLYGI